MATKLVRFRHTGFDDELQRRKEARIAACVGCHVTYEHEGRTLLGEVTATVHGANGVTFLRVKFFNGESWPVDPMLSLVTFLEREFETVEEE